MSTSNPLLNARHSPSQTPPDLTALAAALQEAAQALLALCPANATQEEPEHPAPKTASSDREGETRSFYFPPATVHLEKDLLRRYRASDFQGLLEEVHTLLAGLVKLMRSVPKDVRVRGYVIASLGAQLEHVSALVIRMRNTYDKVMPVRQ